MSLDNVIDRQTGDHSSTSSKTTDDIPGPFSRNYDLEHFELDRDSLEWILGILVVLSNVFGN